MKKKQTVHVCCGGGEGGHLREILISDNFSDAL